MSSEGSVSHWLSQLKAGDQAAAQRLWERYFHQLVALARKMLRDTPRRAADEEDVALSAFDSFCRGAARGLFPQLADRDNLWRLLVTITARKAGQLARHEHRQKRGGGAVLGEEALAGYDDSTVEPALEQILDQEPTPEFAAQVAEQCRRLLDRLSGDLRAIALWKMEEYSNDEIARMLCCVPRTVERRLQVIRRIWAEEIPHE